MIENFDKAFRNFVSNVREAINHSGEAHEAHKELILIIQEKLTAYNLQLVERPDRKYDCIYESETDVIYFIMEWA